MSLSFVRASLRVPFFTMLLVLAACAGGGSGGGGGAADTITQQQIDEAGVDSALEVIRRYRARWLQPTRSTLVRPVAGRPGMPQDGGDTVADEAYAMVFLDGVPYGEIRSLSSIRAGTVASIQFVSASDARRRYGAGYEGGIIEVRSR